MSHDREFHANHAALWHVKYSLDTFPIDDDKESFAFLAQGAASVLCCASAFEAIVNSIFMYTTPMSTWDDLKIKSKVITLAELKGATIDFGTKPWQDISKLIRLRNWLMHHKEDPFIGYTDSTGEYVGTVDSKGVWKDEKPTLDPEFELNKKSVESLYNAVREAGLYLAELWELEDSFEHLKTEIYTPIVY